MAYSHVSYEVNFQPFQGPSTAARPTASNYGVRLDATGLNAKWAPGYMPHIIRGAAILSFATTADTDPIKCGFEADISAPGTPTRLFTITIPTTRVKHSVVYYKPTYRILIKPGMEVDFLVTAAATAGRYGKVVLYVEPSWEDPSNLTGMLQTT